jgi:hypothetical protein
VYQADIIYYANLLDYFGNEFRSQFGAELRSMVDPPD